MEKYKLDAGRRTVLRSIGAGIAGSAAVVGTATAEEPDTAASAIGIGEAVRSLIRQRKANQAVRLLEKHDVPYDGSTLAMPPVGIDHSDVSIQDQWTKSASTFNHYTWLSSGDSDSGIFQASTSWNLNQEGNYETDGPADGVGVTINPDLWEPVLNSWEFDNNSTLDERGSKGVIVDFDDPTMNDDVDGSDTTGWFDVELEKTEPGSHNVYGTYVHTWLPGGMPGGVSFGLAVGPLSVSVSGSTDTWTKRDDNNV